MIYRYIIITPAKNEEKFIEKTIQSVINQTVLPVKWVIVDDGSTDRTAEIVSKYLPDYSFICLIQRESNKERNFGSKVMAIKRGFEEVKNIDYDFYCNLDADVSFEQQYFEFLLKKFYENPRLGICGGRAFNLIKNKLIKENYAHYSIPGFTQFFRRTCYEQVGGYLPYKYGNEDGYLEIQARRLGWETKTFEDIQIIHWRPSGSGWGNKLRQRFISGKIEYFYQFFYPYHFIRAMKLLNKKPFLIGSISMLAGFLYSFLVKDERINDQDFVEFLRKEQKKRLLDLFKHAKA